MKILIIGSGGREYALGHKILQGKEDRKLYFAPGNGGTKSLGENIDIKASDLEGLLKFALEEKIDFTVVGPEAPLCDGIVDLFEEKGLNVFGPKAEGARFEKSKAFTKNFLVKHNILTAKYFETTSVTKAKSLSNELISKYGKSVLKADGLAAGKGVKIVSSIKESDEFIEEVLEEGIFGERKLIVEEFVEGFEMSLIALTDSKDMLILPTSKDHKKVNENEKGPNTGGMGTYAPNLEAESFMPRIKEEIVNKVLKGLKEENIDYRGALFIGLMINQEGIYVLEFNTRFGDPETQVILPLIENDLLELLEKTSKGKLKDVKLKTNDKKAICLVLASGGYPATYKRNLKITFDEDIKSDIFHAGTIEKAGTYYTSGGRVLNLISVGESYDDVVKQVYEDARKVHFDNMQYRKDIGPTVKRVYVSKKDRFNYISKELREEIKNVLGIETENLKVYNRYDLEISDKDLEKIKDTILSETVVDHIYTGEEALKLQANMDNAISVSYLPGQFDQRRQALIDTCYLVLGKDVNCQTSKVYEISGVTREELKKIEDFLVNPVDSQRVPLLGIPTTLSQDRKVNRENPIYEGFNNLDEKGLRQFVEDENLAMNYEDLKCIQDYFKSEDRNPNLTEIRVLDTYWSDHCRHTTFNTYLKVGFDEKTALDKIIKETFQEYLQMREELGVKKEISLMNLGTILGKYFRHTGELEDMEVSSEINACSVKIKVRVVVDGKEELRDYLLMFKNETHNHPTEIEPLGGASTCLGGAIRDPLSGRSYVYQAMRISGASDPRKPIEETMPGKLPQLKIVREAALGYSSYGNQIGLPSGFVEEVYHPGFVAKRLEAGAVIAAAPMENVVREEPEMGDVVVLLGGKTGRDGIGGATGSSKTHTEESINTESAQVQKGNAPEERKIQRLFRNGNATKLIKKCNDFGAGGVCVAIGEIADGITIHLDRVPLKYQGLSPMEIAISESQERMAVLIREKDVNEFAKYCEEENLEHTVVAEINDKKRMIMLFEDEVICELSYDFINTNGANRNQDVLVETEDVASILKKQDKEPLNLKNYLKDLNITSQKNLMELFDSSVGRSTVLHPYGGNKQYNQAQAMCALIPYTDEYKTKTCSIMSYGYNPYLSEQSQFLGGYYAVIESITKLIATGSDLNKIRLTFQEYYEKLTDEKSWSKPLKSLLGSYIPSKFFNAPAIGGKDSMSGTFEDISVPPTLISFAVTTQDLEHIISQDFKKKGRIGLVEIDYDENGMLNLEELKSNMEYIHEDIVSGNIITAIAVNHKGTLPLIYNNAVGNTGFNVNLKDLYSPRYGTFIVEYLEDRDFIEHIGEFSEDIVVNGEKLDNEELKENYLHTLDKVFRPKEDIKLNELKNKKVERRLVSNKPCEKPFVTVASFPGTNSEWDTLEAFKENGAVGEVKVFRNQNKKDIENSIEELAESIRKSQIFAIPGGFSMGDEPDGSGKFIANVLRNEKISNAIDYMLKENDGLVLGICNGFQALIKTGLLPYGKVTKTKEDDPSITFNTCRRHIACIAETKILTNNSPWLTNVEEKVYKVPISHGEGRFVVTKEKLQELLENEQVVSQYVENFNGADYSIESIMSKDGKVIGKMGHSERVTPDIYKNIYDIEVQNLFKSAVEYFTKGL
ncbi:MAG: phosphoribosylformylglycinamidine synthase [Lagierella massiliensis]|nr:phosphoribosylformylglycinamidine synthase [Lagierella massiliensis]